MIPVYYRYKYIHVNVLYVHVCMYVCMYVSVERIYVRRYVCMYVCMYGEDIGT